MLVLAGCAVGERPTLVEPVTVNDEAARQVLSRLELADTLTFTATYEITPSLTGQPTTATVVQAGLRQRVTIGDVVYSSDGTTSRTCVASTSECVNGLDDARVSNLSITHAFWSDSIAARLRTDAGRTLAPSAVRPDTIAGRPSTCADLQLPTLNGVGTSTYCAADEGVLARYSGADVTIELTSFAPTVEESQLSS